MELLINQVGYECDGEKSALLQCGADLDIRGHVRLLRQQDDHLLLETPLVAAGCVPGWQGRHYWRADFSAFTEPGHYRLEAVVTTGAQERLVRSPPLPSTEGCWRAAASPMSSTTSRDNAPAAPSTGRTAGHACLAPISAGTYMAAGSTPAAT